MKLNVLLDSELNDSKDIRTLLVEEGHEVTMLFEKTMLLKEAAKGVYHIIVLDCCPAVNESDKIKSTVKKCKELDPRVEIICIGLQTGEAIAIEAIKYGASACIATPLDQRLIRKTLTELKDHAKSRTETFQMEQALYERYVFSGMVSKNPGMLDIFTLIKRVAPHYRNLLILGDTGTGKEVLAKSIHLLSNPSNEPFVACNCSGLVETLIESELFGHVKGAFTGAVSDKKGLFEAAGTGTIFLDEIGDMPLSFQPHLLRVLQDGEFRRVGSTKPMKARCRVIAASNVNLQENIKKGLFREDLYFRLAVITIKLPALWERVEDIRLLCQYFLKRFRESTGKEVFGISLPAQCSLAAYDWPGNIRELENVIERAVLVTTANFIRLQDLPDYIRETNVIRSQDLPDYLRETGSAEGSSLRIDDLLTKHIQHVLAIKGGNKTDTAAALGISRRALQRKLEKYGITAS